MSTMYVSLEVSPRKKRSPPSDDEGVATPKKLRTALPTPRSINRPSSRSLKSELASNLTRLLKFQNALQQALAHALATCAISPSSDSGRVLNVLNHISLKTYSGFATSFDLDDLKRLCWVWEWDGECLPKDTGHQPKGDNPFLDDSSSGVDWTRGSMGFVLTVGSHYSKADRKRIAAYGVGIEVEMDIDKDMGGGMAAVARWTAAGESRRSEFLRKLERWSELHSDHKIVPPIPIADLPPLPVASKPSALTRTLASQSPKSSAATQRFPIPPSSPSRSPTKKGQKDFAIPPFPVLSTKSQSPTKQGKFLFPTTPSRRNELRNNTHSLTPQTPSRSIASSSTSDTDSVPSTPVHQRGSEAATEPQTPTSSRRQALYERIRQRSLSKSPTKASACEVDGLSLSRDQMLKLTQDEMRRRCLLGRLTGVAESVWMLFSNPGSGPQSTPSGRRRRTIPKSEVAAAVIKSSPVPISMAEANESLNMLVQLCPFFLKDVVISGKEWLEMPSSNTPASVTSTPTKSGRNILSSPSTKRIDSAEELLLRSPRTVKKDGGGLRLVREIIRREMESED